MRGERLRRLVHVASAAVLLVIPIGSWNALRWCLACAAAIGLATDAVRLSSARTARRLDEMLPVFRTSERGRLSGATWLAMGYALAALVPPPAPVAGILVGATADPAASAVGTWKRPAGRKSLQGTIGALVVSGIVLSVLSFPLTTVLAGSAVAALLERLSYPFDDNLVVPPAVALVTWFLA